MPSAEQLRSRLLKKIKELFQLDQPDLDFGFYRIMHAKAQHVQDFIDKDLLKIVADAFGQVDDIRKDELQVTYDKAIQTARDYGAAVPEETEPVKKAKAALDSIKDAASHEGEIYDHLYRFFERYYDDGDFISRRYYTRETAGKAAPFAIPYNGEEVKLHWANADLFLLFDRYAPPNAGTVVWDKRNPMNGGRGVANQHEYIIWRSKQRGPIYLQNKSILSMLAKSEYLIKNSGGINDEVRQQFSVWVNSNSELSGGEKAYRYIDEQGRIYQSVSLRAPEPRQDPKFHQPLIHPVTGKLCAIPPNGFSRTPETLQVMVERGEILFGPDESTQPRQKMVLTENSRRQMPSLIQDAQKGKAYTDALGISFPYCHPVSLYEGLVGAVTHEKSSLILDYFAGSGTTGHAIINLNREDGGKRKYILVEMGDYFDAVLKPRIAKVVYSESWKNGKPTSRHTGISHCFKYLRLESYEDTLNNLQFDESPTRNKALAANASLKEDYMLRYLLDVETRGSQSLLNIDALADPTAYTLQVKKPGSDEYFTRNVDIIETFHYLIGLRVGHIAVSQTFNAAFKRILDPELPEDQRTKLLVDGKIRQDAEGPWWFRKIEGWVPKDTANPNNGQREKVLIVWRKLTGDLEKDNLMLDEWFQKNRISTRDFEFDTIYVNGSNNLPNLLQEGDTWKVRLIEEEFMKRMWDVESA